MHRIDEIVTIDAFPVRQEETGDKYYYISPCTVSTDDIDKIKKIVPDAKVHYSKTLARKFIIFPSDSKKDLKFTKITMEQFLEDSADEEKFISFLATVKTHYKT